MTFLSPEDFMSQIDGATIVAASIEEGEGMHLILQDGRTLIVLGAIAISLLRNNKKNLH